MNKIQTYLIIFLLIILYTFWKLPQTFYQQDEWLGLGHVMTSGFGVITEGLSLDQIIFGEGRPLSRLLGVIFFQMFGLNTFYLGLYSIFLHYLNTILVFFIVKKLFRKNLPAFIAASFFAINSVHHQAVTWFGASFGLLPAVLLILISIYFYLEFIQKNKKIFLYISFFCTLISLYFKEVGVFMLVFLPLINILFKNKSSIKDVIKIHVPFIMIASLFALYRSLKMFLVGNTSYANVALTSSLGENPIFSIIINSVLYPLTSFSLIFIPAPIASDLTFGLTRAYYPYIVEKVGRWDLVTYTSVLDLIAVIISFILLILLIFIYHKRMEFRKIIQFSLLFFFLSIMPYIMIGKEYAYMEPRYYYLTSAASGMIIAIFFTFMFKSLMKKILILFLIVLLFLGYLKYQVKIIRMDIAKQVTITTERKAFLNTLNSYLPTLKSNTNVFYFTGNESWLVDGNMTPFQHGFGYSVMVIYYQSGKIPKELLASNDEFLFALGEQGYRSIDGLNFGYFNKYEDLKQTVVKEKIKASDIHAFYFDRKKGKLYDISDKIRDKIFTDNSQHPSS